jgi:hypothetical protein
LALINAVFNNIIKKSSFFVTEKPPLSFAQIERRKFTTGKQIKNKNNMKKIILSLTTALIVSCTSAEDAETFMNQYKNMEGAQYENITSNLKTDAEKNKDKNPKNYEFSKKIEKAQYVHIELSDDERKAVTKEIENIDNYKCLYQINDKSGNTGKLCNHFYKLRKPIRS